ncbi:hypothetical protein LK12_18175 [Novosphingobium malaysiense]|uniref:TonB-dependent receptor n=2 Tax=Novosphingobium malaysiense TaxID=1348853 RepID=A0A0B1ZHS4_9SPHN|nr:hypothetical protein LK12_18175 [Novosphingobium malaysiense]
MLATSSVLSLAWSAPAWGQEAADATEATGQVVPADATPNAIVVTGSRIARDGYEQPTPVTVASTDELMQSTPTNLPDALNKLPQFLGSSSPTNNTQTNANVPSHGNILNLRNVGGIRTLILQDGVRVPPTAYTGTVDTNIIPQMLVERVDVVTAGASAAYGSDAVSGVVNFVLDKDFTGVRTISQYGISDRGDNANWRLGGAVGFDVGSRGHIIASYEHFDTKGIKKTDRPRLVGGTMAVGSVPNCAAENPGLTADTAFRCNPGGSLNPYKFYDDLGFGIATFGGLALSGPFAYTTWTNPGDYGTVNFGTPTGSGGFFRDSGFYYIAGDTSLSSPLTTDQAFARGSYELTDDITAFVSASYGRSKVDYDVLPNLVFSSIFSGNAFLPQTLQDQLTATGTPAFVFSKSYLDLPLPHAEEDSESYNIIGGLEGKVGRFDWNVSYVYGHSKMKMAQSNVLELVPFAAALDAVVDPSTGNVVCNASLSSDPAVASRYSNCVPSNPFGVGAASDAAINYVTGVSRYKAINESHDVMASISGDLVDLWAGPLSVAVGAEYREQSLNMTSNADPAVQLDTTGVRGISPTTSRFFLTNLGVADGSFNVKEAFAEVALPLMVDAPFVRNLDINGAVRATDYSTSGTVVTWKVGGTWSPVDDLTFRITRSRDIRAPTLFDLFAGEQSNIQGAYDPHTDTSGSLPTTTAGNPNLDPEIGNTLTFGVVFQPAFLPGFSAAIDWYDLKITDAIGLLSASQILQTCEDSGGTSSVCDLITRPNGFDDRSPDNYPTEVRVAGANIAKLETSGFDAEASYRTMVGNGNLAMRLFVNYTDRYRTQQTVSDPVIETAGYGAQPKWRGTLNLNYENGPFGLFLQERYIGKVKFGNRRLGVADEDQTAVYAEDPIDPVFYTDLTLTWKVEHGTTGQYEFFTTVNNLFDKKPPFAPPAGGAPGLLYPTIPALYDVVGRRFTFGVRTQF